MADILGVKGDKRRGAWEEARAGRALAVAGQGIMGGQVEESGTRKRGGYKGQRGQKERQGGGEKARRIVGEGIEGIVDRESGGGGSIGQVGGVGGMAGDQANKTRWRRQVG